MCDSLLGSLSAAAIAVPGPYSRTEFETRSTICLVAWILVLMGVRSSFTPSAALKTDHQKSLDFGFPEIIDELRVQIDQESVCN
jgi:hypothetical protein